MEPDVEAHLAALSRVDDIEVDKWRTLIDNVGVLAPMRDRLLGGLRVGVRTKLLRYESVQPRCSRLGGLPELPAGAAWPTDPDGRALWFLGQINLDTDLRGCEPDLPNEGLLSFFSHPEPNDGGDFPTKVIWTPPGLEVSEIAAPDDLVRFAKEWSADFGRQGLFDPVRVSFEGEFILPHAFDVLEDRDAYDDPAMVVLLAFSQMTKLRPGEARILGWPNWTQNSEAAPNDRLLLQLRCSHPSEDQVGICLGEGDFFILIDDEALAERNWDAARGYYECG